MEGGHVPVGKGHADRSTYAEAWNNLAVGYEYSGRFEDAEAAYQRALKLEPNNAMIRQNYDLFNELNDRTKRRRDR